MDKLPDGHDGVGRLDPVLCSQAVPGLRLCQQRHAGFSAAHGDLHLQILPVSLFTISIVPCSAAVPGLRLCQQRHAGVSAAHGDLHFQVLPVSPSTISIVLVTPRAVNVCS